MLIIENSMKYINYKEEKKTPQIILLQNNYIFFQLFLVRFFQTCRKFEKVTQ